MLFVNTVENKEIGHDECEYHSVECESAATRSTTHAGKNGSGLCGGMSNGFQAVLCIQKLFALSSHLVQRGSAHMFRVGQDRTRISQ